jgi:hypothetical protein
MLGGTVSAGRSGARLEFHAVPDTFARRERLPAVERAFLRWGCAAIIHGATVWICADLGRDWLGDGTLGLGRDAGTLDCDGTVGLARDTKWQRWVGSPCFL